MSRMLNGSSGAVMKTLNAMMSGSHEDNLRKGRAEGAAEEDFISVTNLRNSKLTASQIRAHRNASQSSSRDTSQNQF